MRAQRLTCSAGCDKVQGMIALRTSRFRALAGLGVFRMKPLTATAAGVATDPLVAWLRRTEFFCNTDPDLLRTLLEHMHVRRVKTGTTLLHQGAVEDCFVALAVGRAHVRRERAGTMQTLAEVNAPAAFGEETLLGQVRHGVTVQMLSDGMVLSMRRREFTRRIAASGTAWLTGEAAWKTGGAWLWIGPPRTCPKGLRPVLEATPAQLRERMKDLAPGSCCLCAARDDGQSALAAFVLTQHGFKTYAVRHGRGAAGQKPRNPCDG